MTRFLALLVLVIGFLAAWGGLPYVTLVVVLFAFAVAVRMLASPALSVAGLAVFFVG